MGEKFNQKTLWILFAAAVVVLVILGLLLVRCGGIAPGTGTTEGGIQNSTQDETRETESTTLPDLTGPEVDVNEETQGDENIGNADDAEGSGGIIDFDWPSGGGSQSGKPGTDETEGTTQAPAESTTEPVTSGTQTTTYPAVSDPLEITTEPETSAPAESTTEPETVDTGTEPSGGGFGDFF